jgi:single-strand DNA-binding protein
MGEPLMAWDAGGHIIGTIIHGPALKKLVTGEVVNLTVEARPRRYERETGDFVEVTPVRIRCNARNGLAQHIMSSLEKGDRVVAIGRLRNNDFTDDKGVVHHLVDLELDSIGPDLRYTSLDDL